MSPNLLTLIGILPPTLFFVLVYTDHYGWAIISSIGFIVDMLDGAVARATGQTTAFGGFLDSTIDRLSDGLIITAFGFAELASWESVISLLILSYLISYTRSRAELAAQGNISLAVGILERTERLVLLVGTLVIYVITQSTYITQWLLWLLVILSLITVIQRTLAAKQLLNGHP